MVHEFRNPCVSLQQNLKFTLAELLQLQKLLGEQEEDIEKNIEKMSELMAQNMPVVNMQDENIPNI